MFLDNKGNQYWYYTSEGKITRDNLCIGKKNEGSKNENHIELINCEGADIWSYDPRDGLLRNMDSDTCLKVSCNKRAVSE